MTAPSVSERLRELAEDIKDGPTFDPTRRDHMSTVRVLEALATEIEAREVEIATVRERTLPCTCKDGVDWNCPQYERESASKKEDAPE